MAWTASAFRKLWTLIRRGRFRSELDEEMSFDRVQVEKELPALGMSVSQAKREANRQFSNAEQLKERSHEVVGGRSETVGQELRYAVRQMARNPGFAVMITLTLAPSIGGNSAIFSMIDAVLLKSLPYPEPDKSMRPFQSNAEDPQVPLRLAPLQAVC